MCEFCINPSHEGNMENYTRDEFMQVINDVVHTQTVHLQIVTIFIVNYKEMVRKELCKPYLELLMGRIYAKHATSYSWGGIMQKCVLH